MKYRYLFLLLFLSPFVAIAQGKGDCDVITLKNGALIYCKIISVKKGIILYKDCSNPVVQSQIRSDSATMINHPDGSYEMLHGGHSSSSSGGSSGQNLTFIAIEGGVGIPLGNYGSNSTSLFYYTSSAGFARPGPAADAYATFLLDENHHFGMSLLAGYSNNNFDFNSYFNSLSGYYSFQGESISLTSNESSFYHNYSFMIGPTVSASLGQKVNLDFSALFGACINGYSGCSYVFNITYGQYTQVGTGYLAANNLTLFGVEMKAGIRFHVSDKICLLLNGSFFSTTGNLGLSYYTNGYLDYFRISMAGITAGVSYELGK